MHLTNDHYLLLVDSDSAFIGIEIQQQKQSIKTQALDSYLIL